MSSQLQVSGEAKIRAIQGPVVANSGVITALDGDASQYVRGDGTLADFPTSTGGGSSVSYYLNSSVSQGTIGGVAYRQLSKTPISGAGTDIAISTTGYVASYITDANDPALLEVPAGNFNCEFYFSVNSNSHNPYVYAELYKYDGTTFTLLGSNVAIPEYLTNGTTLSAYYFAIPVAVAALTITDRLAIRIYVNVDGRVVTLHTENNHLCQVVTTFSKGLISLNNLTRQNQFFGTGTSGTDFAIVSSVATHTFNLPVASAANTGKLSSTDWSTFNGKQPAGNYVTLDTTQTITAAKTFSLDILVNSLTIGRGAGAIATNTVIGSGALAVNTTGFNNTAIGYATLGNGTTASNNVAIGYGSGVNITTGSNNTLITGGGAITTGSNNTIIGNYAGTTTLANNIVLADGVGNIRYQWNGTNNVFINPISGTSISLSSSLSCASASVASTLQIGSTAILYGNVAIKSDSATSYFGLNVIANGNNNLIALNHTGTAGIIETQFSTGGSYTPLQFLTGGTTRLTIASTGEATFTGSVTASSLVKSGGTSSQFLKADGSVDSNTYLTTSAASSTYLPLAGGTLTGALIGTQISVNTTNATGKVNIQGPNDSGLLYLFNSSANARFMFNNYFGFGIDAMIIQEFNSSNAHVRDIISFASGGNVGIGTSSPTAITGFTSVCVNNATTGGFFEAQQNGTVLSRYGAQNDISFIDTVANIPFIIKTNSAERMRITSGGNVGIGTSSPATKLDVNGTTKSTNYTTINNTASIAALTTATVLTLSTSEVGVYIIQANFGAQGNAVYGSTLIVVANAGSFRVVTNGSGANAALTLSGANVQITNALGSALDATASAILIAN